MKWKVFHLFLYYTGKSSVIWKIRIWPCGIFWGLVWFCYCCFLFFFRAKFLKNICVLVSRMFLVTFMTFVYPLPVLLKTLLCFSLQLQPYGEIDVFWGRAWIWFPCWSKNLILEVEVDAICNSLYMLGWMAKTGSVINITLMFVPSLFLFYWIWNWNFSDAF